jgi:hypothetical protein
LPGESKFRVTTKPIHKLVPFEEQTLEEEAGAIEDNNEGDATSPPVAAP